MNPLPRLRALGAMIFRRSVYRIFWMGAAKLPWYRHVRQTLESSLPAVTLMWCARNFPEAPPALWQERAGSSEMEQVRSHPMLRLMRRPNPYYGGVLLWMATITDWKSDGNAYWLKVRDNGGQVQELWWTPSWTMTPKGTRSDFITHYEYRPDGDEMTPLRPEDVVHFRFGFDPEDPLRGMSPLKPVLREVFADDEAATFTATILKNMGVPGILVSPEKGVEIDKAEAEQTKKDIQAKFTGDRRGEPLVMTGATKVEQFGFSPEQLVLTDLRQIPEERVSAALGVPAIVVGLGAGLKRSTFTNMGEAAEYAYSNGLIPDQRIMADVVQWQLLTEWEADPHEWVFGFDLSKVRALQEDLYKLAQRMNLLLNGGGIMVAELRRAVGFPVDDARDNIFLRQANQTEVRADSGAVRPLAPQRATSGMAANDLTAGEVAREVELMLDRRDLVASNGKG